MKFKAKHLNTFVSMLLLIAAVFSAINVSYSYFTSKASKSGELQMGAMLTYFRYTTDSGGSKVETKLELIPDDEIEIGVPFKVGKEKSGGGVDRIKNISIFNDQSSCECYARYWIEAYVVDSEILDGTVDYGRFFSIKTYSIIGGQGVVRGNADNNYCYFVKLPLGTNTAERDNYVNLSNESEITLTLQDIVDDSETLIEAVPTELLGEKIEIYLSFQSVQNANQAYKAVFDDDRGWYSAWT